MEKQIHLQEAVDFLDNASALLIDDNFLVSPSIEPLNNDPAQMFLICEWFDNEGEKGKLEFRQEDNNRVTIYEDYLVLIDTEGDTYSIKLLEPMKLKEDYE